MSLDISRIKAICFDIDGTLSDTDDQWVMSAEKWLKPIRWMFTEQDTHTAARKIVMAIESPGNLLYHILDRLHLDDNIANLYSTFARKGVGKSMRHFLIIPEVKEMLVDIRKRYPISVVSARGRESTIDFLKQYDLYDLFHSIATAQTCEYTKPFPHPVRWAAEQMGFPAEDCLMVGDTAVDIKAGKAAGAQTIGVLCGFGEEKELVRAGADLILPSTADLMDVLNIRPNE